MSSRTTYQPDPDSTGTDFQVAVRDMSRHGYHLIALDISCDGSTAVFLTTDRAELNELAFSILRQVGKTP